MLKIFGGWGTEGTNNGDTNTTTNTPQNQSQENNNNRISEQSEAKQNFLLDFQKLKAFGGQQREALVTAPARQQTQTQTQTNNNLTQTQTQIKESPKEELSSPKSPMSSIFRPISSRFSLDLSSIGSIEAKKNAPVTESEIDRHRQAKSYDEKYRTGTNEFVENFSNFFRETSNSVSSVLSASLLKLTTSETVITNPTFGIQVSKVPIGEYDVPIFICEALKFCYTHSVWTAEGLFRINGNYAVIDILRDNWNRGIYKIDHNEDFHNITGLFKRFFKELPDPILTTDLYNDFVVVVTNNKQGVLNQVEKIRELVSKLPVINFSILKRIVYFLRIVCAFSRVNKMNDMNIAKSFGPTFLAYSDSFSYISSSISLLLLFLNNFDSIFGKYNLLPFEIDIEIIVTESIAETIQEKNINLNAQEKRSRIAIDINDPIFQNSRHQILSPLRSRTTSKSNSLSNNISNNSQIELNNQIDSQELSNQQQSSTK